MSKINIKKGIYMSLWLKIFDNMQNKKWLKPQVDPVII